MTAKLSVLHRESISLKIGPRIYLPLGLQPEFERLVSDCAAELGEDPKDARRAVEIAVLQRGIRATREGLR